jgi:hypothetical protein
MFAEDAQAAAQVALVKQLDRDLAGIARGAQS